MKLSELRGIGPKKEQLLHSLGIETLEDMIDYLPVSYEDRSHITALEDVIPGSTCYIEVTVQKKSASRRYGRSGGVVTLTAGDSTGRVRILFFHSSFLASRFQTGERYRFFGKIDQNGSVLQMVQPQVTFSPEEDPGGILPVYRTVKGISQKELRRLAGEALEFLEEEETLPPSIVRERRLMDYASAIRNLHFPENRGRFAQARYRMIYENCFLFQTAILLFSGTSQDFPGIAFPHDDAVDEFESMLPYQFTGAQRRALDEIVRDMETSTQMQRLLQGDVGSGKTAVAAAALYKAAKNGCQGVLMAPTSLLAEQHAESLIPLFARAGLKAELLTGSLSRRERTGILERTASGETSILIGTHAVIQKDVEFSNLGLVITDEQHRFGVGQRIRLTEKGARPDVLVMTATPIPRSLAVVLYGDMHLSVIDELPAGRLPVITKAVTQKGRGGVYQKIETILQEGEQIYIVAPLITESEEMNVRSAEEVREEVRVRFPDYTCGLVHGALPPAERSRIMRAFAEGEIQILVATVVIEVGINVPNATVMLIENAERFGLAQLHQLRGRVGRGNRQSYCYLITDSSSEAAAQRVKIMESTTDGLALAEQDLSMRGPGDLFGTRQHGIPASQLTEMIQNRKIMELAFSDARAYGEADPLFGDSEHRRILDRVTHRFGEFDNLGI